MTPKAPSAQWYLLSVALSTIVPLALGIAAMSLGLDLLGRGLAEAIGGIFGGLADPRLNNVETFPGRVTWQLDEKGPWNVRVAYDEGLVEPPPLGALRCALRAAETGATVDLVPCRDDLPAYHPGFFRRPRRSAEVLLFTIPAPGAYVFEAGYPDGAQEPKLDLAASKGHSGEPLGRFWTRRRKSLLFQGGAALSFAAGGVLAFVVWRRRRRAAAAPEAPSPAPERDSPPENPPGPPHPVG